MTIRYFVRHRRCVSEYLRCDGYDDCWDESDERNCNNWKPRPGGVADVPITVDVFDARAYKMIESYDESTMLDDIQFKLIAYKMARPDDPLDGRTVTFDHMKKVVIYIPGFMTDDLKDGVDVKNALMTGADDVDCVVLADWRKGSYYGQYALPNYSFRVYPPNSLCKSHRVVLEGVRVSKSSVRGHFKHLNYNLKCDRTALAKPEVQNPKPLPLDFSPA